MQQETIFELKNQARRLRTALQEQFGPVSHVDSLNLFARSQGHKNWEALEATYAGTVTAAAEQTAAALAEDQSRIRWLALLTLALGDFQLDCEDLDELVHDAYGSKEASAINNDGLASQLGALLDWHKSGRRLLRETPSVMEQAARASLVSHLQTAFKVTLNLGPRAAPVPCALPDGESMF